MTKLLPNRPVIRETASRVSEGLIILEAYDRKIELRVKGKKTRVFMSYEDILKLGRPITWRMGKA